MLMDAHLPRLLTSRKVPDCLLQLQQLAQAQVGGGVVWCGVVWCAASLLLMIFVQVLLLLLLLLLMMMMMLIAVLLLLVLLLQIVACQQLLPLAGATEHVRAGAPLPAAHVAAAAQYTVQYVDLNVRAR